MKKIFFLTALTGILISAGSLQAQDDKAKRPSPPAKVKQTINGGAVISIDYSQPSLKGRTMGKEVEPMKGQIWRAGANEATVFEVSKPIKVEGENLPAGKYALFAIANDAEWTIIFNKIFDQWGSDGYKESEDALRVKVKATKSSSFNERLFYTINSNGKISLLWGNLSVNFNAQ